jgi:hypothetical protein
LSRQIHAVHERDPDVVALQELKEGSDLQELKVGTLDRWRTSLTEAGYSVLSTAELSSRPYPPPPYESPPFPPNNVPTTQLAREAFNLTASRGEIERLPGVSFEDEGEARFSFPEKYLATRVRLNGVEIDIHNAHVPHGAGDDQGPRVPGDSPTGGRGRRAPADSVCSR